ncbi:HdeD family acid-resistance protein [Urinicoccus massiliensis]|uniref:HdeD family acid-resistance protein n=1 Tax=Urinicoccus massiliensis TaxID=1723382 RepID=UPI00050EDC94|nr:DUF308 domain-containing protein [Urinicoccus massiliensis]KGF11458.1 hypothetical protein HMPREF1633_05445 [Tissierellia bacterium S5-A11]
MKNLKVLKEIYSLFSLSLIVLGIVFLAKPTMAADVFCRICGILLLLFGIVKLFGYFSRDLLQLAFQFDFAMGIISSLIGFVMFFWTTRFIDLLIIGIGLFIVFDALLRIQTALDARKIGVQSWWVILLMALITGVIGVILFLRPYTGRTALVMLIGLNLIIDGILNLFVVQSTVTTIWRDRKWEI